MIGHRPTFDRGLANMAKDTARTRVLGRFSSFLMIGNLNNNTCTSKESFDRAW